ncbi:hypothetical protein CIPAW_12G077400 [Carya illinoinensis]|uniref:Uncharacterized protein n=1 Tax=Carya illinoinensis TaxID=32201 RepID=A0A8T1NUM7_CARIL|nr:hypothetical protein CIPAW_12G077400 [Carya illinoinensis]KAG6684715.1 hypothetical protein I3842_12G076000 [Carya illinoinensis]
MVDHIGTLQPKQEIQMTIFSWWFVWAAHACVEGFSWGCLWLCGHIKVDRILQVHDDLNICGSTRGWM